MRKIKSIIRFTIILVCMLLSINGVASAQDAQAELDRKVIQVYSSVMSPFCPGRLLSDCPSKSAAELKHRVRSQLASGLSVEEVLDQLYLEFGDEMRALPKGEGFGLMAWVIPFVFLGLGFILILYLALGGKKKVKESA
ncbi:cytochrome c-type biogenesis protein CcmH [Oligoflexia bacterium]|nr:cytochrome c-type biogenesis protein CcmH [Oligoflexia bacterium]